MAMKGRHWDSEENAPTDVLKEYLDKKAESVKTRIHDATGVTVEPVCYSAGYADEEEQQNPYNLSKLLYYVLMAVPSEKRLILADNLNEDDLNWADDDGEIDYQEAIHNSFWGSLCDSIVAGTKKGSAAGELALGMPGSFVGGLVGAIFGGLKGLIVQPIMNLANNSEFS